MQELKYHFCTLFDSAYLSRGLAMYESLSNYCSAYTLYIFTFDDLSYDILSGLSLKNVVLIPYPDFEDDELLKAKDNRSRVEYFWTCTASTILYVLHNYKADLCTYIDADVYFFSSPVPILKEIEKKSILITEHRFSKQFKKMSSSGIYNVQFISFRNDSNGLDALYWWKNQCLISCENNQKEGKCGDQKYLDDWTTRFKSVHVMEHEGGGLAPWNMLDYRIIDNKSLRVHNIRTKTIYDVIFFHFHSLALLGGNIIRLAHSQYFISDNFFYFIYIPYIKHLNEIHKKLFRLEKTLKSRTFITKKSTNNFFNKSKILIKHIWNIVIRNRNNNISLSKES